MAVLIHCRHHAGKGHLATCADRLLSMDRCTLKYFYENLNTNGHLFCRVMVPLVLDLVQPKSVADIGCGIGTWLKICREHGVEEILGVDGGTWTGNNSLSEKSARSPPT